MPPASAGVRTVKGMTDTADGADSRSMRERMLAGDLYIADDPELGELSSNALDLAAAYNATSARQRGLRRRLLEELLGSIGEGSEIRPPLYVDYGSQIRIGARCFANFGLVAADVAAITIGDDVQIGPNVQLLTPTHPVPPEPRRQKWEAARPITIGDNVWLGGGAIVLPGVSIGENTVVGAGAVVTRDLPANVVAAGNPARVIRPVDQADAATGDPPAGITAGQPGR
jgi:maltose O-acetyltransferase